MSPPWGVGTSEGALANQAVGCKAIVVGIHLHLLDGGRPTYVEGSGWVIAPPRMLYRSSASDLATANSMVGGPLSPDILPQKTGLIQLAQPLKKQEED